jgi:serine phosphatase RsbU (regulator of sigma subunit)
MMAVPLQTEDGVIGLVYVDSPHLVRDFGRDDLNLLTVLGNVAANRIEHERLEQVEHAQQLLERDLEQAAEIQSVLLPAGAPDLPGVELAGENSACRGVGGDYYDFLPYPDGRVALILGDVSGKGIPAALLMASLQARIQTLSAEPFEPQRILARLNRALAEFSPENRFISLFFCLLDPATGEISYSNAGHNPPVLIRADGSVELLEAGGMVLGIFPEAEYEGRLAHLAPGDLLALYSDGLTEARSPGDEEFGEQRLEELLRGARERPVPEILALIRETVRGWREGAPPEDDETIVLARRSG